MPILTLIATTLLALAAFYFYQSNTDLKKQHDLDLWNAKLEITDKESIIRKQKEEIEKLKYLLQKEREK